MNSKFFRMLSVAIVGAGMAMACHTVSAQEAASKPAVKPAAKPAFTSALELRKTGIISVSKDDAGKIVALKLIVNMYDIPLDEGSKPLENMDGQKVRVTGTFSNEDGLRRFYVKSVEAVDTEGAAGSSTKPVSAK